MGAVEAPTSHWYDHCHRDKKKAKRNA